VSAVFGREKERSGANFGIVNLLFTEAQRTQHRRRTLANGLNPVNLLRLSAVASLFAAALSSFSHVGAAQSLSDASIAIDSGWTGGYMRLGGGLGTALVKRARSKSTASLHRPRHAHETHYAVYAIDDENPIRLVARSLDNTGLNIGSLGAHVGAR